VSLPSTKLLSCQPGSKLCSSGADGLFIFPQIGAGDIVAIWDSDKYPEIFSDIIKEVSAAVPLPVVIHPVGRYSIPFGQGLPIKTTKAILDACPNIVGWKMTYNFDGYRKIARFLQSYPRPVNILAAVGHYMHENHADRMFDGTSSGAWNYALEPMMEHLKAWRKGDWKTATDLWEGGGLAELQQWQVLYPLSLTRKLFERLIFFLAC
jgi:4-hydroxy-tetrahydrodipicolinate synthase